MFKQTSNYLNSISNLQGVPFFAALTPSFLLFYIYVYIYIHLCYFSLISGPATIRSGSSKMSSGRVKSTRDTSRFCSLLFLFMSRTDPLKGTLANSSGVATRFSNWTKRDLFFFLIKFFSNSSSKLKEKRRKREELISNPPFLIIVRRQHFFEAEKIQNRQFTPDLRSYSNIDPHSWIPHKRGITSVYPVQCLSVYLCPRLTPDPSRQTAQSRGRKRGLCR